MSEPFGWKHYYSLTKDNGMVEDGKDHRMFWYGFARLRGWDPIGWPAHHAWSFSDRMRRYAPTQQAMDRARLWIAVEREKQRLMDVLFRPTLPPGWMKGGASPEGASIIQTLRYDP